MRLLRFFLALTATLVIAQLAFAATTYTNLDQASGWNTCAACGGPGGTGPTTPHTMTQGISSPSLDGRSTQFWVGGTTAWANNYWWKTLSGTTATHFVYDAWFYLKNPAVAHALEFDANQYLNGKQYIYGTECVHNSVWKIFDTYNRVWRNTSIPCVTPKAFTWNHLIIEFNRINGRAGFVSITINGVKHYINTTYAPRSKSATYKTTVAFQMDEDKYATDYSVWLDKFNFTLW